MDQRGKFLKQKIATPNGQPGLDALRRKVNRLMRVLEKRLNENRVFAGEYSNADTAAFASPAAPAIRAQVRAEPSITRGIDRWLESINDWAAAQRGARSPEIVLRHWSRPNSPVEWAYDIPRKRAGPDKGTTASRRPFSTNA